MKSCIATVAIIGCVSAAPQRMRVRDLQGSMSMPPVDPDFAVDPAVDPDFAVDPQPEVDPDFGVDPQPEVDPDFGVDPQPEVDPDFGVDPQPEVDPDFGVDPQPEVDPDFGVDPQPEVDPDFGVDPQPEVDPDFGVDPAETTGEEGVTTLPGDIGIKDFPEMSMSMPPEVPVTLPEDEVVIEEILWESLSVPAIYEEIYGSSMSMPQDWTPEVAGFVPAETGSGYVEPKPESDDVPAPNAEEESDDVTKESSATGALISGVATACAVVAAFALF
eukprot:scaffold148366_cov79-Cyclotella_meneghiniana.AAC.2